MTKLETLDSDWIPDVLEWKREIQEQIYQETKNMTTDEFLAYLRKGREKRREERKLRREEQAKLAESGIN